MLPTTRTVGQARPPERARQSARQKCPPEVRWQKSEDRRRKAGEAEDRREKTGVRHSGDPPKLRFDSPRGAGRGFRRGALKSFVREHFSPAPPRRATGTDPALLI